MNRLKEQRKKLNVTARELADLLNLKTVQAYYKKEKGNVTITKDEALILAQRFGVTVEELFESPA